MQFSKIFLSETTRSRAFILFFLQKYIDMFNVRALNNLGYLIKVSQMLPVLLIYPDIILYIKR